MARVSRPAPETPYLAIQGLNRDSNSLGVQPSECVDVLNLRILTDRLETRSGSRGLALQPPGIDPILHFHNYKEPDGPEKLFAFTKNAIYVYSESDRRWSFAQTVVVIDDCSRVPAASETTFGTGIFQNDVNPYEGSRNLSAVAASPVSADSRVIGYDTFAALDLSAHTHISFWMHHTGSIQGTAADFSIKFYDAPTYTTQIATFDFTIPASTQPKWTQFIVDMSAAGVWTSVQSYQIRNDNLLNGSVIAIHLDYMVAFTPLATDVNFWHTCDFVDDTYGATVVAAGSLKPSPNVAESDAAARVLLFFDTATEVFDQITLTTDSMVEKIAVSNEATTVTAPNATTATGDSNELTGAEVLIAGGLFSISTSKEGTLGRSSGILTTVDSGGVAADGYLLLDIGDENLTEGENASWVKTNGDWKITTAKNLSDGGAAKLFVSYTFGGIVAYKPRYVWGFHDRLVMGNTCESGAYYSWRIRWSTPGDLFVASTVDFQDLVQNDSTPIQGGDDMGFYLNIYKTDSLIQVSHVGGDLTFLAQTAWTPGTFAGRTIQTFQGRQYFLGEDDVYVWDGAQRRSISINQQVGQHRVRDRIFELLNINGINSCFGSIFPKHQEYWLWIPKIGETHPSSVFVYSILRNVWSYFEFSSTTTVGYFHIDLNVTTWDQLVGTWDEQNWTWDSSSLAGLDKALVLAKSTGDTFIIDDSVGKDEGYTRGDGTDVAGSDIVTRLITRDFIFSDLPSDDRVTRLEFEAVGETVDVSYSHDFELDTVSFKGLESLTLSPKFQPHKYFPDTVGEHIRFAFEATGFFSIRWIIPYAIVEELHND